MSFISLNDVVAIILAIKDQVDTYERYFYYIYIIIIYVNNNNNIKSVIMLYIIKQQDHSQ